MTGDRPPTRNVAYFEKLYTANPDPWNFADSAFEQQKYFATINMLGGRHFSRGLEIGCSIGVLTKLLAEHCDKLLAVDFVAQALVQAAARCAGESHVTFECMRVPQTWPAGQFDLIVLSEILYFLQPADIACLAALANDSLMAGGALLLVNYTEDIDEPCSGEEAAEIFMRAVAPATICVDQRVEKSFRIDLITKSG